MDRNRELLERLWTSDGELALSAEAEHELRTEDRSDYGGDVYYVANVVEFRDGRIAHETRIYGAPFDPPEWRAKYVTSPPQ
ncbi:hypothetical protein [Kribbella jiaozuonensis]|uniref:SnoaL-like domain-containing protein n=1 Tax=Kribbella jiaozuonensis TaxID=2575441 RepID=A0A4U3LVU9_9ACTN|nr:hypothetical protein [Kribbella jiaozuonensis]TKK79679.1 hypothetical protein FDA38_14935 [Kribbella jiaozuonensis]